MLSAERSLKSITSAFNDKPDPGPSRYQVLHNPTTQQLVSKNVTSITNLRLVFTAIILVSFELRSRFCSAYILV